MGAPDVLRSLQNLGLTLTADGERLLVGPSECITDNARSLIREHKAELLILVGGKENAFARAAVGPSIRMALHSCHPTFNLPAAGRRGVTGHFGQGYASPNARITASAANIWRDSECFSRYSLMTSLVRSRVRPLGLQNNRGRGIARHHYDVHINDAGDAAASAGTLQFVVRCEVRVEFITHLGRGRGQTFAPATDIAKGHK